MLHVIFIIGLVNAVATAVKMGLDRYAPTSKADSLVGSALKGLSIALSFLSANTQGKQG
jgi:hypothetical protein